MLKATGNSLKSKPQCSRVGLSRVDGAQKSPCLLPALLLFSFLLFFLQSPDFLTPSLFLFCFPFTLLLRGSSHCLTLSS